MAALVKASILASQINEIALQKKARSSLQKMGKGRFHPPC